MTPAQYLDSLGMWEATAALPEQGIAALTTSADRLADTPLPSPDHIRSVVVFGTGGSGVVADMVAAYGADHSSVPVWAGKGYEAPAFVGPGTLAFAVSYSGDTEETCAAAAAAAERGAHVVVVSGGGALAELAEGSGLTRFAVPADLPASRTALGCSGRAGAHDPVPPRDRSRRPPVAGAGAHLVAPAPGRPGRARRPGRRGVPAHRAAPSPSCTAPPA